MREKKAYKKPQVAKVELLVQSPILANCNSVATTVAPAPATCNTATAICAQVT